MQPCVPREYLVDLYMGVPNHREVDLNLTDNALVYEHRQKRNKMVVLIFTDAIIDLYV